VKLVHLLLLGDVSKVGLKEKVKNCKKKNTCGSDKRRSFG
jgi:hypothetical protein